MSSQVDIDSVVTGDIILVQGTSCISRMIRWATNCRYSHSGIICCRLSNGEFMVIEMLAAGLMIRPLFAYRGIRVDLMKTVEAKDKNRAEEGILILIDNMSRIGYNFKGVLYLGLILIPKRIFQRPTQPNKLPSENVLQKKKPRGLYQWFCYYVVETIATITIMSQWSSLINLFSKEKWLEFTEKISTTYAVAKKTKGTVTYTEFVKIVEDIYKDYKKYVG